MLGTASHYWPLDAVDGIQELWDEIGNRPGYVNGSNISKRKQRHTACKNARHICLGLIAHRMVLSRFSHHFSLNVLLCSEPSHSVGEITKPSMQ